MEATSAPIADVAALTAAEAAAVAAATPGDEDKLSGDGRMPSGGELTGKVPAVAAAVVVEATVAAAVEVPSALGM